MVEHAARVDCHHFLRVATVSKNAVTPLPFIAPMLLTPGEWHRRPAQPSGRPSFADLQNRTLGGVGHTPVALTRDRGR
jgi:hypothetical protein